MTDRDTNMLDAQQYSALPPERKAEIAAELLKLGDFKTIENLGIKIVTIEEWLEAGESDAIEVTSPNQAAF